MKGACSRVVAKDGGKKCIQEVFRGQNVKDLVMDWKCGVKGRGEEHLKGDSSTAGCPDRWSVLH